MVGVAIGVGVLGTVGSAVAETSAASSAANTAQQTAAENNALEKQIYDTNTTNETPYMQAGSQATTAINGLLYDNSDSAASNAAYANFQNSTGYQQSLKTGQDSVTAALGQKGLTDSGAALKALTTYGQNAANGELQTYLGDLQGQQSAGVSATNALAGVGTNYANSVSSNNNTAATTTENAALSSANSISSALNNLTYSAALGSSYANNGQNSFGNAVNNMAVGTSAGTYTPTMSDLGGF